MQLAPQAVGALATRLNGMRSARSKPLRRRRTGCDFPNCSNPHHCRGYCAAHYQQLRQGKRLTPLNQKKGWYKRNGYVYVWEPGHPNADKRGYVAEHANVMAVVLGRPLLRGEEVHHRNGKRHDNRPENSSSGLEDNSLLEPG